MLDERLNAAVNVECGLMDRKHFVENLQMAGAVINTENLVNLAIHEPRSFSCLLEVAHRFEHERIWAENGEQLQPNALSHLPDYS